MEMITIVNMETLANTRPVRVGALGAEHRPNIAAAK